MRAVVIYAKLPLLIIEKDIFVEVIFKDKAKLYLLAYFLFLASIIRIELLLGAKECAPLPPIEAASEQKISHF